MNALAAAVRLLTILPWLAHGSPHAQERGMSRSPAFFPLVGLGIGAVAAGVYTVVLAFIPPLAAAGLAILAGAALTGALHMDGLADTADGLFGGRSPERRLEIMRDPRTGAFGVTAIGVALLLKAGTVSSFTAPHAWVPILLAPMTGRLSAVAVMSVFRYAREQGAGTPYRAGQERHKTALVNFAFAILCSVVASYVFGGPWALIALAASLTAGLATGAFAAARLGGGVTGDVYGAAVEISETTALIIFTGLIGTGAAMAPLWT
ncbi:MAG: adenosylcobinamide-GDP ribazoletransferase [Dehalococcoidia bacterium]|nr:adenosylcobinamide-GDP ribazoletransferase [Dehalococcoidia bacterium]MSQ34402.1 adenosylcobinamide-GDP ribazoletransferase [Dehalococcoidia bacterium]